jgi:predicted metal-dependent phosphoesterase TrpH
VTLKKGVADLHMHTTASDGTSTVKDRVEQAEERGVETIAITDHDCIHSTLKEPVQKKNGVEVITGVEIKADFSGTKIEILGYLLNPEDDSLGSLLKEVRRYRRERNQKLVENFIEVTGIDTSYDEMAERARGQLGRPHFARLLIQEDLVESISEAFDEYLGENGDIYVPTERVDYTRVIDSIHEAGGVASLAHPGRIDSSRVPEMVKEMSEYGLDGIEVWYPYGDISRGYDSGVGVEESLELAKKHSLFSTGGSDCHGDGSSKFRIGKIRAPAESVESLHRGVGTY